jgi:surface polysaccharide O-acyltransferase-like enzyme
VISNKTGELDEFFYGYTSLTVIASAFTLFIYIKQLDVSGFYTRFPNLKKFISLAASTSFSVYLIHLIILEMLYVGTLGITIDSNTFNPIIGIPLIVAIVSIFSGLIVLTLRRIPIIRWFFP